MKSIHVTKHSKDKYGIKDLNISDTGKTLINGYKDAEYMSGRLKDNNHPYEKITPALIYALSLIDKVYQFLIKSFISGMDSSFTERCYLHLKTKIGDKNFGNFLSGYSETYCSDNRVEEKNYELLKDLITLGTGYRNKAYIPLRDIFFSTRSEQNKLMLSVYSGIETFFESSPGFGSTGINLIKFLRLPSEKSPDSVLDQLTFIIENWGDIIGDLRLELLTGLDHLKEENKVRMSGSGPYSPYSFLSVSEGDRENFSSDSDWMSSLVLLAKSTYVWLDQLSKIYKRDIHRIDQIPDEELDRISNMGFSGLWLIGLWERSKASAEIKKRTGNPEAMASAYSIDDYIISSDLGGEEAFLSLKRRAEERGIRLAADMVPNHMGIDSKWVCEHSEWFISSDSPPFGSYTFNGPDLCEDGRYTINLEDHYYNKSDAAVVFEFTDNTNGNKKYIYHGNDGTSMPWNDTAQLNYLMDDVRKYIIDTIIKISGKFSIIRFDAAMILTKKHFQRLWFPEPGHGGDIPSRAGRGVTSEEFNRQFPNEFWMDVVENIAERSPDTLLLAEAFWMMEPYFVRTLGMHRVYNSAFMNFLKAEENREFRISIKNTIEFNPEILKRFANFMNNPDEETAVSQFGSDDKYFGVCTLLATLPGLPMFGHGQIEGFTEKYGMEYRKAYRDETPDKNLLERHRQEIFPLLKKRNIFSQSENFRLYDFIDLDGKINEDVIAYSNFHRGEHSIVVFNNRYSDCSGSIHYSSLFAELSPGGGKSLKSSTIGESLKIRGSHNEYIIFRDNATSLQYIRKSSEIIDKGLYFELGAFKYHTFLRFKIVTDTDEKKYCRIDENLAGKGIADIEKLYNMEINNPVYNIIKEMFLKYNNFFFDDLSAIDPGPLKQFLSRLHAIISEPLSENAKEKLSDNFVFEFIELKKYYNSVSDNGKENNKKIEVKLPSENIFLYPALIPSLLLININDYKQADIQDDKNDLLLKYYIPDILDKLYSDQSIPSAGLSTVIKLSVKYSNLFYDILSSEAGILKIENFFKDEDLRMLINYNEFEGKTWYSSEFFRLLAKILFLISIVKGQKMSGSGKKSYGLPDKLAEEIYSVFLKSDYISENLFEKLIEEINQNIRKIRKNYQSL